jgi:hypothetical protein
MSEAVAEDDVEFLANACEEFTKTLDDFSINCFFAFVPNTKLGRALMGLYLDIYPVLGMPGVVRRFQMFAPWGLTERDMPRIAEGAEENFASRSSAAWVAFIEKRIDRFYRQLRPAVLSGALAKSLASEAEKTGKATKAAKATLAGLPTAGGVH